MRFQGPSGMTKSACSGPKIRVVHFTDVFDKNNWKLLVMQTNFIFRITYIKEIAH